MDGDGFVILDLLRVAMLAVLLLGSPVAVCFGLAYVITLTQSRGWLVPHSYQDLLAAQRRDGVFGVALALPIACVFGLATASNPLSALGTVWGVAAIAVGFGAVKGIVMPAIVRWLPLGFGAMTITVIPLALFAQPSDEPMGYFFLLLALPFLIGLWVLPGVVIGVRLIATQHRLGRGDRSSAALVERGPARAPGAFEPPRDLFVAVGARAR